MTQDIKQGDLVVFKADDSWTLKKGQAYIVTSVVDDPPAGSTWYLVDVNGAEVGVWCNEIIKIQI